MGNEHERGDLINHTPLGDKDKHGRKLRRQTGTGSQNGIVFLYKFNNILISHYAGDFFTGDACRWLRETRLSVPNVLRRLTSLYDV